MKKKKMEAAESQVIFFFVDINRKKVSKGRVQELGKEFTTDRMALHECKIM